MKVFITGATGYIGHKLAIYAASQGYFVHALVRNLHSKHIPVHALIVPFEGDLTDMTSIRTAMQGCDMVIHAAANANLYEKDSSVIYRVNVEGTKNVLDAALSLQVRKFVFTSSCAVFGTSYRTPMCEHDPRLIAFEDDYEISKQCAEDLVRSYCMKGLHAVIVALSKVYGPGLPVHGNFIERVFERILRTGIAFTPFNSRVQANYTFVDDVIKGHFLAAEYGACGESYILGGENVSYHTFFHTVRAVAGKHITLIPIPQTILLVWSFCHRIVYRLLGVHTNISPLLIKRFLQNRTFSSEKAIRQLGYRITPFREGLRRTFHHLQIKNYA
ncbi:MAG TPA: NAD-dependent epimerase/dehydratase family protein [Saprospiraceae bacterium]|nr:NAD-dependent epimerase/dehydratase family protein [Saprospiraceae bacterium]